MDARGLSAYRQARASKGSASHGLMCVGWRRDPNVAITAALYEKVIHFPFHH